MNFDFESSVNNIPNPEQHKLYDLLIIGSGPAGLNAALYAKRKGLEVAIITKNKGGQILDTSSVDNYLGIYDVTGQGLVEQFLNHVLKLEVPILENTEVIDCFSENKVHCIVTSNGEIYRSKTLLIATGARPRQLSVPGEKEYIGSGVSYCAICDGPFFRGMNVFVAGGGNSAVEAALDLSKFAAAVTIIPKSSLKADKVLLDQIFVNPKINVLSETKILEIQGNKNVMTGLTLENAKTLEKYTLEGRGIFVEIGHVPNTNPFNKILKLNSNGEIITDDKKGTNIPGIFAAGDVTDSIYKQIIISAGEGAIAALAINEYIKMITD